MSSSYYTPSGNPIAQARGTSPAIRAEFSLIDTGFSKLPTPAQLWGGTVNYVVDSGTPNAYVIAPSANVVALTDGLMFNVRFTNANTGASTLTLTGVGGASNVPLVRPDGTALASGDLIAGEIVTAIYQASMGKFQLSISSVAAVTAAAASATAAASSASAAAASSTTAQTYAAALNGTSATSVAIATGSKSFTASTAKQWVAGSFLLLASTATPTNFMFGQATSYNSGTGALVVNVLATGGSGTAADWIISLSTALPTTPTQSDIIGQVPQKGTTGGTSTAYTLTPSTAIGAYTASMKFSVTFNANSGDQPTLQISGVASPPNLVKLMPDGTFANIRANDITANLVSDVVLLSPTQAWVVNLPVMPSSGSFNAKTFAADFTLDYSDNGASYEHTSATPHTVTIPTNAAKPLPPGFTTTIIVAPGAGAITVSCGDTLMWLGPNSTGNRTITVGGAATIMKSKALATRNYISGNLS